VKKGVVCAQPSQEAATRNPFPYVLVWENARKGKRCQIVNPPRQGQRIVLVEFEDGHRETLNRQAIRRAGVQDARDEQCRPQHPRGAQG